MWSARLDEAQAGIKIAGRNTNNLRYADTLMAESGSEVKLLSRVRLPATPWTAYKLNKQGDNIQLWRTPFPIWNQSVVPCPVLNVASWPAYRFSRGRSGGWYSHLFQNFPQGVSNNENSHKENHLNTRPGITQPSVAPLQAALYKQ